MSEEYEGEDSSIHILISSILSRIQDETTEEQVLNKIQSVVKNITDKVLNSKYVVRSVSFYLVDDKFPRLTETNIPYEEIEDVSYCLNVNVLKKYKEN